MVTVNTDLIEESELIRGLDKTEKNRIYKVSNLAPGTPSQVEYLAIAYVPQLRTVHESIPYIWVTEHRCKAQSVDIVHVRVKYSSDLVPLGGDSTSPGPVYELDTTSSLEQSSVDQSGNFIAVSFGGDTQYKVISVRRTRTTLTVTRIERNISPNAIQQAYVNKVNSTPWQGYAAGFWFCPRIHAHSTDGGTTWTMIYAFELNTQPLIGKNAGGAAVNKTINWNPVVYYHDSKGDLPSTAVAGPPSASPPAAIHEVLDLASVDFTVLGL